MTIRLKCTLVRTEFYSVKFGKSLWALQVNYQHPTPNWPHQRRKHLLWGLITSWQTVGDQLSMEWIGGHLWEWHPSFWLHPWYRQAGREMCKSMVKHSQGQMSFHWARVTHYSAQMESYSWLSARNVQESLWKYTWTMMDLSSWILEETKDGPIGHNWSSTH